MMTALAAIAWPLVLGLCLWKILPVVRSRLSAGVVNVRMFGVEISLQDASENLGRQIADLQQKVAELRAVAHESHPHFLETLEDRAQQSVTDRVLWVDDRPANNAVEVGRLRSAGAHVDQVVSTDEALRALARTKYTKVISDMERAEDGHTNPQAGLNLIQRMSEHGLETPVYIYCSQRGVELNREELLAAGAAGVTSSPLELFEHLGLVGVQGVQD
jgi:CheY-like chemotaxis protein